MNIKLKDIIKTSQQDKILIENLQILKELILSPDNAVPVKGGLKKGTFTVGDTTYSYSVSDFDFPFVLPGDKDQIRLEPLTVDIGFSVEGDKKDMTSYLPKGGKENIIKVYSTIFKIISTVAKSRNPNHIVISSYDASGYFPIYNNLTKTNKLPGYSRKSIIKWNEDGKAATSIVLKKNN